jgi:hypothetical protein
MKGYIGMVHHAHEGIWSEHEPYRVHGTREGAHKDAWLLCKDSSELIRVVEVEVLLESRVETILA